MQYVHTILVSVLETFNLKEITRNYFSKSKVCVVVLCSSIKIHIEKLVLLEKDRSFNSRAAGTYRNVGTGPQQFLLDNYINPIPFRGMGVDYAHHIGLFPPRVLPFRRPSKESSIAVVSSLGVPGVP